MPHTEGAVVKSRPTLEMTVLCQRPGSAAVFTFRSKTGMMKCHGSWFPLRICLKNYLIQITVYIFRPGLRAGQGIHSSCDLW